MDAKTTEFTQLIDQAIQQAEKTDQKDKSERIEQLIDALKTIKQKAISGQLEASQGVATLGLAREVADWIETLDSPLLKAVGQVEEYYQSHL